MPDQGQLWSGAFQIAKETTPGTYAPATRKIYLGTDSVLSVAQAANEHRFQVGRPDNRLAVTQGPTEAAGSVSMDISDEMLELLLIGVRGGVSPSTPSGATNARLWTFKPGGSIDSASIEWDDGANVWNGLGARIDNLTIAGDAMSPNRVSGDLFLTDVVAGSLTGALTDRIPTFIEGWQTRFYCDSGSVPGLTPIPGALRNWSVQMQNALGRQRAANNTLATRRISRGELNVTASLTFDAYDPLALAEFNNWRAGVQRIIRLEFLGPADGIEAGANEVQTIATTGTPTGGGFTVKVLGQTTASIAFGAAASAVQTAINNALAVFGPGYTVTCTGGPLPAAVTVTFSGSEVAGRDIPTMSLGVNSLTGGTAPAPVFATTTPGRSGRMSVQVDLPGVWTGGNIGGSADGIRTYEMAFMPIYNPTLAGMMAINVQTSRTAAFAA